MAVFGYRTVHRTVIARSSHGYRTVIATLPHGYSNLIARLSNGYRNLIATLSQLYRSVVLFVAPPSDFELLRRHEQPSRRRPRRSAGFLYTRKVQHRAAHPAERSFPSYRALPYPRQNFGMKTPKNDLKRPIYLAMTRHYKKRRLRRPNFPALLQSKGFGGSPYVYLKSFASAFRLAGSGSPSHPPQQQQQQQTRRSRFTCHSAIVSVCCL